MKRPRILTGALVGFMATAPLVAVLFLGWRALSTPFTPFDLFDWLARALPGSVVTFGIDTLVEAIRLVAPGSVAELAKPAEQALAILLFLVLGSGGGAILFALAGRGPRQSLVRTAAIVGAIAGGVATVLGWNVDAALAVNLSYAVWLVAAFGVWGLAVGWSRDRLAGLPDAAPAAEAARVDRRTFLVRLGGATALLTAVGAGVGSLVGQPRDGIEATDTGGETGPQPWSAANDLPNAGAEPAPAPGTRPELTPLEEHYRIDINTISPGVDASEWRLTVHGLVDAPTELTLDDIRSYPALDQFITLSCISNRIAGDLISTQRWTGVSMQELLPDLGLEAGASHLLMRSVDGFFEVVSLEVIRNDPRVMLAYAWDGLPLPREHGYPLRIYIPNRYGMKQPKWIESIEVMDHWEAGYWVERGWDREAMMKATSVIDTVAVGARIERDGETLVPIGGIAHAGDRGVSRVEVQVDDGGWEEARLRPPLSAVTWVVWRYDWPFAAGRHTFAVRCFDGAGTMQILEPSSVRPDGATGVHSVARQLTAG